MRPSNPRDSAASALLAAVRAADSTSIVVTVLVGGSMVALAETLLGGKPPIWESILAAAIASAAALYSGYAWRASRDSQLRHFRYHERLTSDSTSVTNEQEHALLALKRTEQAEHELAGLTKAVEALSKQQAEERSKPEQRPNPSQMDLRGVEATRMKTALPMIIDLEKRGDDPRIKHFFPFSAGADVAQGWTFIDPPAAAHWRIVPNPPITAQRSAELRIQALHFLRMVLAGESLEDALDSFSERTLIVPSSSLIEIDFGTKKSEW